MTKRTTKKEILELEDKINYILERRGTQCRTMVIWAYGMPRCHLVNHLMAFRTEADLSPRLEMREMKLWLQAFLDGLTFKGDE